jgi:hypothetical protein
MPWTFGSHPSVVGVGETATPSPTGATFAAAEVELMCILSTIAAVFTLLVAGGTAALSIRQRRADMARGLDVSAVVDLLIIIFLFGCCSSLRFIVAASLKLQEKLEPWCPVDVAFGLFFYVPQIILEGVFLVFLNLEARGSRITQKHTLLAALGSSIISFAVVVGILGGLAAGPGGLRFSYDVPWCFVPNAEADGQQSARLELMRFAGAYGWFIISDVIGLISIGPFLYRMRALLGSISTAVAFRALYFVYIIIGTTLLLMTRFHLDPASTKYLVKVVCFIAPSFVGVNAAIFLVTEREWLLSDICPSCFPGRRWQLDSTDEGTSVGLRSPTWTGDNREENGTVSASTDNSLNQFSSPDTRRIQARGSGQQHTVAQGLAGSRRPFATSPSASERVMLLHSHPEDRTVPSAASHSTPIYT